MKILFSPLIAGASGRAADAVAASWKGRSYVRKYVVPANPDTTAQGLVRDAFTHCVTLWRSLSATLKLFLDSYGSAYTMSGFNVYMSKNRAREQASSTLKPVPDNPLVCAPTAFAVATGAGAAGTIDLSWTNDAISGYTKLAYIGRKSGTNIHVAEDLTTLASVGTKTVSGLTAGATYEFDGWYYRPAATGVKADMGTVAAGSAAAKS